MDAPGPEEENESDEPLDLEVEPNAGPEKLEPNAKLLRAFF
jgi:hypothetical protein